MQWVTNGCYAGALVLYLITKYYFENECKKRLGMDLPGAACCKHCTGQYINKEIAANSNETIVFHMQGGRQANGVAAHISAREVQGYIDESCQCTNGQF
ncbi:unnamed protein product, partial [Brenthis ino]